MKFLQAPVLSLAAATSARSTSVPWVATHSTAVLDWQRIPRGGDQDGTSESPNKERKARKSRKQHNPIVEEILQNTQDYYQVLGVSRDATARQITKAYRRRAVQTHPDKTGGDRRAFDHVAKAYEVLSSEEKRAIYDRHGKDGLQSGHGMSDVFQNLFRQGRQSQNYTVRYQLQVTLEDLYRGTTQSIWVSPPTGGQNRKQVQVSIPRGATSGQAIVLSGEMDFVDTETPGDIVFVVAAAPHPVYTRKNHDLALELTITLEEAICGLERPLQHLDGSEIWISSARTRQVDESGKEVEIPAVIETGDVQVLKGRGFPKSRDGDEFGDLYVQFRVEMPKTSKSGYKKKKKRNPLTEEELEQLRHLLSKLQGGKKSAKVALLRNETQQATLQSLQEASVGDFGRASGRLRHDRDESLHTEASNPFQSFGTTGGGRFYFGGSHFGHPFGAGQNPFPGSEENDEGNVQCQQM